MPIVNCNFLSFKKLSYTLYARNWPLDASDLLHILTYTPKSRAITKIVIRIKNKQSTEFHTQSQGIHFSNWFFFYTIENNYVRDFHANHY